MGHMGWRRPFGFKGQLEMIVYLLPTVLPFYSFSVGVIRVFVTPISLGEERFVPQSPQNCLVSGLSV
jgi:hypothetical protein